VLGDWRADDTYYDVADANAVYPKLTALLPSHQLLENRSDSVEPAHRAAVRLCRGNLGVHTHCRNADIDIGGVHGPGQSKNFSTRTTKFFHH
jgi:hypothetical protein